MSVSLTGLHFEGRGPSHDGVDGSSDLILDPTRRELDRYIDGRPREFTVRVDPSGTELQRRVWAELRAIPYAVTASYGEIARRLGSPSAVRAVGAANGASSIAIVAPCHPRGHAQKLTEARGHTIPSP